MDITALLVLSLATWRISSLLVNEDGPWDIFMRLRHLAGVRYDDLSVPYSTGMLSELLTCVWCTSVWVSIPLTFFYFLFPGLVPWLCLPLALSAAAILFEHIVRQQGD